MAVPEQTYPEQSPREHDHPGHDHPKQDVPAQDPTAPTAPGQVALEGAAASAYVSLTTFRKSGVGVATPVWIGRSGDDLVVLTVGGTGKTKRLARDPRVELRPCDVRGRIADDAPVWSGVATVADDEESIAAARRAIGSKYLMARLGDVGDKLTFGVFRRRPRAAIRITLD